MIKSDLFRLEIEEGIATIWIDSQKDKMNIVSPSLIGDFENVFKEIETNEDIIGAILISAKKDFIAGADIKSFKGEKVGDFQPFSRKGHELLQKIEDSKKPIVSAIHGTCYGLGVELSLACNSRVCSNDSETKLALPEVKLGLLPGGGGTQRLPRLVGLQASLDMMLTGKNIFPSKAKRIGLVDEVVHQSKLHKAAKKIVLSIIKNNFQRKKVKKSFTVKLLDGTSLGRSVVFSQAKKTVLRLTKGNYPAPIEIIECVKIGLQKGLNAGYEAEVIKFEELILSNVSSALRNLFFTTTEKKKNPYKVDLKNTQKIGVIGAGFMGEGITEVSINSGMDVLLKDLDDEMIHQARKNIWKNLNRKVKRRQMSKVSAKTTAQKAVGQLDYKGFNNIDVVVEAIVENMTVKKKLIKELESICKDDFIFASNTSSLPLTEMSEEAKKPENVVGMHYFSPVTKMPLLEIIKTNKTSEQAIATCYEIGKRQGKTCIVVNDAPGFYVNRILCPYLLEALILIEEGVRIEQIDKALKNLGMPVGPVALLDEVGIDVGVHVMSGNMTDLIKDRDGIKLNYSMPKMLEDGLSGRKSKKGFYNYVKKKGKVKKGKVNEGVYKYFDSPVAKKINDKEITERCILILLNEAVWALEEGIIENITDGDIGGVFGIGFLPWSGGPFSYMNQIGISNIVDKMKYYQNLYGNKFQPRPMLIKMVEKNEKF
ncbi:MAG: 3-hydroxyacyl-CoA dehydrogenase NAD-binding domain-containing protein [Flavobacteriales bacterium]|jgi:3-hydroxyacyl-CoA dehydrogenase/enoyl-CoA hydratase/3-hydroxybutyryl-CoA epimerase|nr:3-hydroxyacyl-CoA dehydrogenase NAD-binding domain-containing protein [Flavobacteriales bacterium]